MQRPTIRDAQFDSEAVNGTVSTVGNQYPWLHDTLGRAEFHDVNEPVPSWCPTVRAARVATVGPDVDGRAVSRRLPE